MVPMTITDPAVPDDVEATGTAPASPAPRRSPWLRRLVIAALIVAATTGLWWGSKRAETGLPASDPDPAIVAQFPPPGAQALRQTEIGAQLKDGYDGRLSVNGVAVPEAEMEGVIVPGSPEAAGYDGKDLRPNNRDRVFFSPGPGKAVDELHFLEIDGLT